MTDLRLVVTGFFIILNVGLVFKIALFRATLNDLRAVERSGINGVRKLLAQAAIRRVRAWLIMFVTLIVQLMPRVMLDVQAPVPLVFFVFLVIVSVMLSETYAEYHYRKIVRDFIMERLK